MRRRAVISGIGACCAHSLVAAQVPSEMDRMKPYLQVKPVKADQQVVRVFFTPSCQYSRTYLQFFKNLEATLPAGKAFNFSNVVNSADGLEYAMAFLAVRKFQPQYLENFVEASLTGVQDLHISTRNWTGIYKIGQAAHVPVAVPKLVYEHRTEMKAMLTQAVELQHDLGITNTPAVAVAGTYVVTPEFTNGDAATFSELVNGIISMAR